MKFNMVKYFTWKEFDQDVEYIADKCKFLKFSGIYGIPRGGLCLAVALSHRLNVSLISEPKKNSLIVDDVYETGITLNSLRNIQGAMFFVLFSKSNPTWYHSVNLSQKNEWIVFPWENKDNFQKDREYFLNKRKLK